MDVYVNSKQITTNKELVQRFIEEHCTRKKPAFQWDFFYSGDEIYLSPDKAMELHRGLAGTPVTGSDF